MKKDPKRSIFLYLILAAILGGGMSTFVKVAVGVIPPATVTFWRFLISFFVLLPFALRYRKQIDKNFFHKAVPISLLASANVILFAFGVKLTSVTASQLMYTAVPVVVAIFSFIILKERFGGRKIFGITLGLLGVLIIILFPVFSSGSSLQGTIFGNLMIFLGVIALSIYSVLSKPLQKKYSPILLTTTFAFMTTLLMLPVAYMEYSNRFSWIGDVSPRIITSLFYTGIFGGIYYFLHQNAIKRGSPVIASTILFLQPAATYTWAFFLLSESLTASIVIGGTLAIIGAWQVTKKKK